MNQTTTETMFYLYYTLDDEIGGSILGRSS